MTKIYVELKQKKLSTMVRVGSWIKFLNEMCLNQSREKWEIIQQNIL